MKDFLAHIAIFIGISPGEVAIIFITIFFTIMLLAIIRQFDIVDTTWLQIFSIIIGGVLIFFVNSFHVSPDFIKKISNNKIKCNTLLDLDSNDYIGNICYENKSLIFSFNKNFFNLKLPPSSTEIDEHKLKNGLISTSKELGIPIDKNEIMNMPTSINYDKNDNTIVTFYMKNTKDSLDALQKFFIKNHFSTTNACDEVSDFYMPSGLFGDRIYYYNDFYCNRFVFVSEEGHEAIYNKKLSLELILHIPNLYYKEIIYNLKNNIDKLKYMINYKFIQKSNELSKMNLKIKAIKLKNKLIIIKFIKNDGFSHNQIKKILTTLINGVGVID